MKIEGNIMKIEELAARIDSLEDFVEDMGSYYHDVTYILQKKVKRLEEENDLLRAYIKDLTIGMNEYDLHVFLTKKL